MSDEAFSNLHHFDSHYVHFVDRTVEVVETDTAGAGTASFLINSRAVKIRAHRQAPLIWALSERKCADGAFITFGEDGTVRLHIVELKGHIRSANWPAVQAQFRGMYLTSLAVARLLNINNIDSVVCYLAAKRDGMSPTKSASPTLLKTLVGGRGTLGGREDWENAKIDLPLGTAATLVKGWRDAMGNVSFGSV